jgi:hypothetical protein
MSDTELLKEAEENLKGLFDSLAKAVSIRAMCNGRSFMEEVKDEHCVEAKVLLPALETLKKLHARLNP